MTNVDHYYQDFLAIAVANTNHSNSFISYRLPLNKGRHIFHDHRTDAARGIAIGDPNSDRAQFSKRHFSQEMGTSCNVVDHWNARSCADCLSVTSTMELRCFISARPYTAGSSNSAEPT